MRLIVTPDGGFLIPQKTAEYVKILYHIFSLCKSLNLKWDYKQFKNKNKRDRIIIYVPKNKAGIIL
jgi:hypothetical protein